MLPHQEKSKINLELIDDASFLDIAPWMFLSPTVWFDLTKFEKDAVNPETRSKHIKGSKECYVSIY